MRTQTVGQGNGSSQAWVANLRSNDAADPKGRTRRAASLESGIAEMKREGQKLRKSVQFCAAKVIALSEPVRKEKIAIELLRQGIQENLVAARAHALAARAHRLAARAQEMEILAIIAKNGQRRSSC